MEFDDIREFIKMSCIVSVGGIVGFIIAIVAKINIIPLISLGCSFTCLGYSIATILKKE